MIEEMFALGIKKQVTYQLQYIDYKPDLWTAPVRLTRERIDKFYPDFSLNAIKLKFSEYDLILSFKQQ